MAKQLNVDLRFNADTSAAKAQLQSLQTSINQLTTTMATQGTQLGITPKIQEAQQAAVQLKTALQQSMNIETGKFDLSKFNSSLKSMNTDLSQLKTQLVSLGPSGQQTFMTLAQSIMTAEIPTKRISASLAALGTTLKNTAKWQLSSTMLHGFMSAVQTSYRYAQDLNESLNNIRIVTGESAEAMDKFAAKANKAAKALSASTLDYTDAALIFYQQGLKGKDVEDRTEVTLKLANVSRQSAEVVSDQMTAIWNNFYDGSKSLEYYADVLTALGASTASSTEEIAGGLEKFAAVGETIGLSYEYAASALATITANTRQSEEVVGTALKTIFARVQGLKLGETLEDGTSLNKYSQALETVGVHIYNASGGLKNMDQILDETAEKWGTLTRDQQAALAQTVAGIRQYTQFIALMDNWNDGTSDSMVNNLKTANESMGTLQEQQDIYAESWEAARDRAQAAAEELYMSLLDDDFFIGLTDGFADFLGLLDNFIDAMGGAKGLLSGLASILLYTFSGPAAKALENMVYNFKSFVGLTQREAVGIKQQAFGLASNINANTGFNQNTPIQLATTTGMQNQLQLEQDLLNIKDKLTEAEQLQAKYIIEQNNAYSQQAVQVAQQLEIQKEKTRLASQDMREAGLANWDTRTVEEKFSMIKKDIGLNEEIAAELERVNQEFLKAPTTGAEQYIKKIEGLIEQSRSRGMEETATHLEKKIRTDGGKGAYRTTGGLETQARADKNIVDNIRIKQQQDIENKTRNSFSTGKGKNKEQVVDNKTIEKTTKSMTALVQKERELDKTNKGLAENTKKSSDAIKNLGNSTRSWSQTMVGIAQGAMSLSFAINSLNSLKTTWADKTIGTGEKLLQTFMSLGMAIPMLVNGINGLKTSFLGANSVMLINEIIETRSVQRKIEAASVESILAIAKTATTDAEKAQAIATAFGLGVEEAAQLLDEKGILLDGLALKAKLSLIIAQKLENLETSKGVIAKSAYAIATTVQAIAQALFNAQLSITAGLIIGLVAIIGLLAFGIWGITKAWQNYQANTPEEQLKAAKEEAKSLNEQLNETRKAAEDLKSSFDDYNQIVEKLANCKKGTQEWTEALKENNDKVLELMEQYPELSAMTQEINGKIESAVSIGPDGELIIADWAYDRLYRAVARSGAISSIAANYGQQDVNSKEIRALENKIEKSPGAVYTWTETTTKLTGAQKRTGNYKKSKDTRTGVEKRSGKKYTPTYIVTNAGIVSSEKLNEQAKLLIDTYGSDADKHIDEAIKNLNLKGNISKVSDTIESLIDSNLELRKAVEENTASEKLKNAAVAGELMSGYSNYDKSEYKGHINQLVGETLDIEDNQERIEHYQNQITNNSSKESTWKDYIKLVGMTEENGYSNLTLGEVTNDEIKYTYIDENDEKQEKVISTGKVAKTLAAEEQYDISAEYGEHVADYMSTFTSKDQADMFSSLISQDAGFLSQETLDLSDTKIKNIAESFELTTENAEDLGPILKKAGIIAEDVELDKLTPEQLKKINKEIADTTTKIVKQKQAFEKNKATYQQFIKTLQDVNSNSEDLDKAAKGLSKNLGEVFGLENLEVDPEVLKENAGLIQAFFNNTSEDAGKNLQEALASEIQAATIQDAKVDIVANVEGENAKQQVSDLLDNMSDIVTASDFKVGIEIDPQANANFIEDCNSLIAAAGWTADQAMEQFKKMGYDVKIKKVDVEPDKTPWFVEYPELDEEATDKAGVPIFKPNTKKLHGVNLSGGGKALAIESITPNGNGGGKIDTINDTIGGKVNSVSAGTITPKDTGSKNTPKDKTFKEKDKKEAKLYEDEFDRYYDITQALEEYNRELEETQERKDELWGPDKLAAMEAEKKKLGEITAKQKEYLKAISGEDGKGEYLAQDREALAAIGGIFDEEGRLTNYEELTQKWLNDLNAAQNTWNQGMENATKTFNANKKSDGADETYDTTKTGLDDALERVEDTYEKNKSILEKWQETYDLNEEQKQQLEDYWRQMRQLNYEELEYKIEIQVELNENDITDIEHQLERLGDNNIYASAERLAVIQKNAVSYRNIADTQMEAIKEAERLYQLYLSGDKENGISQENYIARLQESKEALQDAEMSIRNGIQQIGEELSDTFDLVDEKLEQQFTKFDQMIKLMDHYKKIVSLTQGEASYKEFNEILKTSQEILRNRIAADESEVAMWTARKEQLEAEMKGMDKNSPEYLAAEEALNNIMKKEADTKSQLMTDIEQLGEYAQEIFENAIEQAKIDFEEAMFGGRLSSVIESIEMLNAKQEEVLTTTNKIYETNKLIRNVEKDIEATTNNRAKQAYAEFQNKVKQKQEQNELTQFELDLLNAEYEITKAQIALEEAQNAKDTVRLTRDSEGNYGYVYTANEDKIADAEQALDDATNNYYNTALEGAQKYQDQIYQHIEEWEEKVTEVMKDQTLSEEEKNKKIAEINATYDEMIRRDKQLYYIAIDGIRDSSYSTQVDYDLKGIKSAENWFDECDGFIEDLKTAQDEYDTNTQEVAQHTEDNFGKMEASIENTKIESEKLKNHIVDELVPELETTLKDSIDNATEAWWKYIEALQEVIRLTDEAMKKNHDTQLTEAYKEDYAAEISKRLANGADYNDYDIQQLLQARWDKMGGVDNTDYQALINAGGTPEQITLQEVLRRFKIDKTDWSSSDASYADEIRATKMDQDFAQLIINYLKSSSHARWSDETVQGYLAARQAKIDERHESAKGAISNEELKNYVAQLLNKKPEQLKTGGYTGSWGPEGRLAVLHEKELVLNAEDTKNFLSATQILREISDMLDHNALVASLGAINLRAMTVNNAADQLLQQEVTIHADFPNVTDHNEIEMAIDNLINAASQHAFKS